MKEKNLLLGVLSIVLSTLIFSTMEVMLKMPAVSGVFHPMQITMERFFIGGICLVPFALMSLRKKQVHLTGKDVRFYALTGLLCVPLSMVLFQLAVSYGQANVISVLFSGNPIFVTMLAFLILHERIYWNNFVALGFEILGIVAIINPFAQESPVNLLSVFLIIVSALLFSLYGVVGKQMSHRYGGIVTTCMSFLFGSAELLLLLLLGHVPAVAGFYESVGLSIFCDVPFIAGHSMTTLPYFLYIALINTAAGYVFHMIAMEKMGANLTNLIFFFKPMIAPLFALAFLHEALTMNIIVGIAFFLCASLSGILPAIHRAKKLTPTHT